MGTQIGMFKSEVLPPGLHVVPNAREALIADGWTEPAACQSPAIEALYDSQMTEHSADFPYPRKPKTASIRARSSEYYGVPYWEGVGKTPRIPEPGKMQALHWCKSALAASIHRSGKDDAFKSWTGAVEGAWWALALDDALEQHFHRIYKEARDASENGLVVKGMRWLRNRHAHDILLTASGGPKKPFFNPPGGGMFYISPSNRWMKSDEIIGERTDRSAALRSEYDEYVAGLPLNMSLEMALTWFDTVFEASNFPERPIPEDPTILGHG